MGSISAHLHAAAEECCSLASDGVVIRLLAHEVLTRIVELAYLAQRELAGTVGHHLYHSRLACAHGTYQRRTHEEVAHEHGYVIIPDAIDGGTSATLRRFVDYIIVYERSIVKQLDRCGCFDDDVGISAEQSACQYREYGAYLLAFGLQKLLNYVFHKYVIATQRLADYSVQLGQFAL